MDSRIITDKDKNYPRLLKKIGTDAPENLYYKGEWSDDIFKNCLAVVGSRHMTTYGKRVVERIVTEVAAAGITIVSGFMYGIDAAAHAAALRVGGKTIAVMPCGIDVIHPEYQEDLHVEILDTHGLVISEYEGDMPPATWTYPRRNRIVAGLATATLVVEAGEKSGSLITAQLAKKFNRKVFAVPGPITSETSKGTLQLIKEGAEMVVSSTDILKHYKLSHPIPASNVRGLASDTDGLETRIAEQLRREPMEIDTLARALDAPVAELGTALSLMQLQGIIKSEGNTYYVD